MKHLAFAFMAVVAISACAGGKAPSSTPALESHVPTSSGVAGQLCPVVLGVDDLNYEFAPLAQYGAVTVTDTQSSHPSWLSGREFLWTQESGTTYLARIQCYDSPVHAAGSADAFLQAPPCLDESGRYVDPAQLNIHVDVFDSYQALVCAMDVTLSGRVGQAMVHLESHSPTVRSHQEQVADFATFTGSFLGLAGR